MKLSFAAVVASLILAPVAGKTDLVVDPTYVGKATATFSKSWTGDASTVVDGKIGTDQTSASYGPASCDVDPEGKQHNK